MRKSGVSPEIVEMGISTRSRRMRPGVVTGVAGVTGVNLVLHRNMTPAGHYLLLAPE